MKNIEYFKKGRIIALIKRGFFKMRYSTELVSKLSVGEVCYGS